MTNPPNPKKPGQFWSPHFRQNPRSQQPQQKPSESGPSDKSLDEINASFNAIAHEISASEKARRSPQPSAGQQQETPPPPLSPATADALPPSVAPAPQDSRPVQTAAPAAPPPKTSDPKTPAPDFRRRLRSDAPARRKLQTTLPLSLLIELSQHLVAADMSLSNFTEAAIRAKLLKDKIKDEKV